MKYYILTVERTQNAQMLVRAPNAATAVEWLQDHIEEFEDNLEFDGYPDYSVSEHATETEISALCDEWENCPTVDFDWLRDNGYEVIISVKRKEPV